MLKLTLAGALSAALLAPAVARADHPGGGSLAVGDAVFWDGATVRDANVPDPALCGVAGECFEYPLTLARGGARLRVAIDTPSREDSFQFQLLDPAGAVAASQANSNQFNEEAFVTSPAAGRWTVRVIPKGAKLAFFRMRAKLEASVPRPPAGTVALLPNLKVVPPYEFGFIAPANPLNGVYPPDTVNPPLDAAGVHPLSCTADEMAPPEAGGFAARRCLRLTSGPINTGQGPYDMRFTLVDDLQTGDAEVDPGVSTLARGPMFQVVHYSNGTSKRRAAGTYSFHTTHAHFHDDGVLTYELFSTDPSKRTLTRAGDGSKSGFCPADQLFGEWWEFRQMASGYFGEGDSPGGNCFSASDGFLGLTVGWGDVYRWQRPGQYVEFGENPDGLYVVRSSVDKGDDVLETNEADNSAYALIRVVGERVDLLERGQGSSPYDPRKRVFEGPGPAGHARPKPASANPGAPATRPRQTAARRCRVPRLKGLSARRVRRKLARAGLRVGRVRRLGRARRLKLRAQSPRAGRRVRCGSRVKLRYR